MDYQYHYNKLIERARGRGNLLDYHERHHILPHCMGGGDEYENLVDLTAREHYLAHLLLVKLHPEIPGLWFAIHLMSSGLKEKWKNSDISEIGIARSRNRLYEWVRKKIVPFLSEAGHKANLGKTAITDGKRNRRIFPEDAIPDGWHIGYTMTFPENGYISLNNGKNNMRLPKGSEIPKGWHEGWIVSGDAARGLKWATDGEKDVRLPPDSILPQGFDWGRTFKPNKGLICVNDGIVTKRVSPEEAKNLPDGWKVGLKFKHERKGLIRITDGKTNMTVAANTKLENGWHRGITRK